jgi:FtsP/CotA-like multicopper oxidase with cupredoxin domain
LFAFHYLLAKIGAKIMTTRRQFMHSLAGATMLPLLGAQARAATGLTDLYATTRVLDVDGKAATVFGLQDAQGKSGLRIARQSGFGVRLHNQLAEPSLIHWHGLTPPQRLDGVPGLSQTPLEPNTSYDYEFPLQRTGTNWMHSHLGGQEQGLLAAPLIITEDDASADIQDVVLMLHDFAHRGADQIFFELTGRQIGTMNHAAMGHGTADQAPMDHSEMMMDLNDVEFDAYLANDRTLNDPEIVSVEAGRKLRLRVINAAASTNFWLDIGALQGVVVAVDGIDVDPIVADLLPIAMAQRIDIIIEITEPGAFPILAQREGDTARTGIILATQGAQVSRISASASAASPAVGHQLESALRASVPLAMRPADVALTVDLGGTMMGYSWDLTSPAPLVANLGQRVELRMNNQSMMSHPMHLHGHHFQVVALGESRIQGAIRDTVMVPAMGAVTIAFDANNPGAWAFHCHNLYHQLSGMMTQFEVLA